MQPGPNPFLPGLEGTEFLYLYMLVTAGAIFVGRMVRLVCEAPDRPPPGCDPGLYAAAYLRGGGRAVLETALVRLATMNLVVINSGVVGARPLSPGDAGLLSPPERLVHEMLVRGSGGHGLGVRDVLRDRDTAARLERMLRDSLQGSGLVPSADGGR